MNVVLISLFFLINKLVVFKLAAAESAELPMFQLPHLTTFQTQSRGCAVRGLFAMWFLTEAPDVGAFIRNQTFQTSFLPVSKSIPDSGDTTASQLAFNLYNILSTRHLIRIESFFYQFNEY